MAFRQQRPWMMAAIVCALFLATRAAPPPETCAGKPPSVNKTRLGARYTFARVPSPNLVPVPSVAVKVFPAYLTLLNGSTTITVAAAPGNGGGLRRAHELALLLADELKVATSGAIAATVQPAPAPANDRGAAAIATIHLALGSSAAAASGGGSDETYSLEVTAGGGAVVTAASYAGLVAGTATLLQAVEHSADHDAQGWHTPQNCSTPAAWRLPSLSIVSDTPALPYRGAMVDAARANLPLASLKSYVVMCRLYKINYLHIHLTDDGAFTFPSATFPELAAKSVFKYTAAELAELQVFAAVRGVAIVGEMDVPGHSKALTGTLPRTFAFASDPSIGIVDFTNASVVAAVQQLFREIDGMFPTSPYIHMGGDEVQLGSIAKLPEVVAAIKQRGVASVADLYRLFIVEMNTFARGLNKTLQVWEGFQPPAAPDGAGQAGQGQVPIPTDIVVQPFDCNIYTPPDLARDGYKIINSAWTPLYIAGRGLDGMHHPVPPEQVYNWNPWLFGTVVHSMEWFVVPTEHRDAVIGAQMCVWQMSAQDTLCLLSSRLPAMAERAWSPWSSRTFADYSARVTATGALLGKLVSAAVAPAPTPTPMPTPTPPSPSPSPPPPPEPGCLAQCGCS